MAERRGIITTLITTIPLLILTAIGVYFWRAYSAKDRLIAEQKRIIKDLGIKLDRAWAEELVADVRVNGIDRDAAGNATMRLTFVQYKPGTESPSFQKELVLPGEEFYIDALVVKFERPLVEAGDGLKGKSMLVFRRAFGDRQQPSDGVPLYTPKPTSEIPQSAEVDGEPTAFEKEIWAKFWKLANDPDEARAQGIKVAQGEAPHIKAVAGQVYKMTLRASGGLDMVPRLPSAVVGGAQPPVPAPVPPPAR